MDSRLVWSFRTYARALRRPRLKRLETSDVVVSLTSWPARINHAWATIDSLLLQTEPVHALVLTLSEAEFPDRRLPRSIRARERRGLTILWVKGNTKSFKKLLDTHEHFPWAHIITVDDDKLYPEDLVSRLVAARRIWPDAVIGHCGRRFSLGSGGELVRGPLLTDVVESPAVYLLGGTGVLYPPASRRWSASDIALIESLCPHHDDAWFWAMSVLAGRRRICLGSAKPQRSHRQDSTASLLGISYETSKMPYELRAIFRHYSLSHILPSGVDK